MLERTGIDAVLMRFRSGADLFADDASPFKFAERILKKKLHAREVHEGYNLRFGHKAAGDVNLLEEFGQESGI